MYSIAVALVFTAVLHIFTRGGHEVGTRGTDEVLPQPDGSIVSGGTVCSSHFEKHCFQNDIAWSMGFAKRRDLIGGAIPTRDPIIPEGPEVLTERHKRQVSERFACFDV